MTYNLPNGSTWDLNTPWELQEQEAQDWMNLSIDPNNTLSKKLKINIDPLFYKCVLYENVEVCFNSKNDVKSIENGN